MRLMTLKLHEEMVHAAHQTGRTVRQYPDKRFGGQVIITDLGDGTEELIAPNGEMSDLDGMLAYKALCDALCDALDAECPDWVDRWIDDQDEAHQLKRLRKIANALSAQD